MVLHLWCFWLGGEGATFGLSQRTGDNLPNAYRFICGKQNAWKMAAQAAVCRLTEGFTIFSEAGDFNINKIGNFRGVILLKPRLPACPEQREIDNA